jgi:hypothetical protein
MIKKNFTQLNKLEKKIKKKQQSLSDQLVQLIISMNE